MSTASMIYGLIGLALVCGTVLFVLWMVLCYMSSDTQAPPVTPTPPVVPHWKPPEPDFEVAEGDPALPPGFDPGWGYGQATPEQKESQAAMAWWVYEKSKAGEGPEIPINVFGPSPLAGKFREYREYRERREADSTERLDVRRIEAPVADKSAADPVVEQRRLDREEAERNGTLAERASPTTGDAIRQHELHVRERDNEIRAMVIREYEQAVGPEGIARIRRERGEAGYRLYIDGLVDQFMRSLNTGTRDMAEGLESGEASPEVEERFRRGLLAAGRAHPPERRADGGGAGGQSIPK